MKATTIQPIEPTIIGLTESDLVAIQAIYMLAIILAIGLFLIGSLIKWISNWKHAAMMKKERAKLERALKEAVAAMARDVANIKEKEAEIN
jgi:hypothetical protein